MGWRRTGVRRASVGVSKLEEVARKEGLVLTEALIGTGRRGVGELGAFYVTADEVGDFLAVGGM